MEQQYIQTLINYNKKKFKKKYIYEIYRIYSVTNKSYHLLIYHTNRVCGCYWMEQLQIKVGQINLQFENHKLDHQYKIISPNVFQHLM